MKIAMMVRGFLTTPVPHGVPYSPASVAQHIAEGLQAAGHDVTFYGPEGTDLKVAAIETCSIRSPIKSQEDIERFIGSPDLFENYLPGLYDTKMAKHMLESAKKGMYDCVIFNHFESVLPIASLFPSVPIVHILHDYLDENRRQMLELHSSDNQHFISISDNQRRDAPDLNYADTIYNGIDIKHFAFEPDAEDYLMYSGRVTPHKGVKEAVQVAVQTDRRLLIAGSLSKVDYWYFDEHIKPFLNDKILYLGMLGKEQLLKYYQKAAVVLMPVQWEEPFGLSMIEANACGTPVIAFRRGSIPEVIKDGKTGFIVDNSAEMIMAISRLSKLNRRDCRQHVEKHFTKDKMVEHYERTLQNIVTDTISATSDDIPANDVVIPALLRRISKRMPYLNRKHAETK